MGDVIAEKGLAEKKTSTELPDSIQPLVEDMSGILLSDVHVHYNSLELAQIKALNYMQGTDIHVAPGRESDLPHEEWHIIQQKQGRVAPTLQMKGIAVNNDSELGLETDIMGAKD